MASYSKKRDTERARLDKKDEFKNKKNPKEQMSNSQLKKNLKKVERGPTKKQLREEEEMMRNKKKAAKNKSTALSSKSNDKKTSDKVNNDKKSNDKKISDKKTSDKKISGKGSKKSNDGVREKKERPIKKKGKTAKIFYTEKNINSFLIEANKNETKDKAINMLLFVFKHFKNNSAEILSKLKILTMDKKIKDESEKIHERVLQHLFEFFELKGSIIENLISMISQGSLLSKYVCDFLFSISFSAEDYTFYFNMLCDEISKRTDKISALTMQEYLEYISEMDKFEDLTEYNIEGEADINEIDQSEVKEIQTDNQIETLNESSNQQLPDEPSDSDESSVSLISLNDDNEIERLDRELGNMFRKGMLSVEEEEIIKNLLVCLETLIKHNYAVKTDDLIKILYFQQFDTASSTVKFIVKDFMKKINDKKRVFKVFQMSSLVVPSVYQFLNIFCTYCGDEFNMIKFLGCVFNFGHEDFIINRIDKDKFYSLYESTLGESFDAFLVSLLSIENRKDKLKELEGQYFKPEIKEAISKSIETVSKSKKNK